MKARLEFCVSMLDNSTLLDNPKFVDMYNVVHIDEKWFYMTKKTYTYYLLPDEDEPYRTSQSKNFIGKIMFLVAMARLRFDNEGDEIFSGKIGVFHFLQNNQLKNEVEIERREFGAKAMNSIKREDIKEFLIEKVIPKIREKWPHEDMGKPIFIQQNNARTHVDPRDEEFRETASLHGFDIHLVCQPTNSRDLNILDLGFFSFIQSLQHKYSPKTLEELVFAVEAAFEGNLSSQMTCDPTVVCDVISYLAT